MHRTKVGNNEVLKWWLGQEKENGLTADLSWCALSEFISSSLCYFPLPTSFLQNSISEVLPPFSFPVWAWQKRKHLGRRLKISQWKQWRKELQFTCLIIWDKFRLSLLQFVLLSHYSHTSEQMRGDSPVTPLLIMEVWLIIYIFRSTDKGSISQNDRMLGIGRDLERQTHSKNQRKLINDMHVTQNNLLSTEQPFMTYWRLMSFGKN